MFFLILHPKFKFKNIHLVVSLRGLEQGKAIVKEYDTKPLDPMHLKCLFSMVGETWNYVPTIEFLACHILGIMKSQIEIERIYFLIEFF